MTEPTNVHSAQSTDARRTPSGLGRVLVVAYDGVIAETLIAREAALTEAALSVGLVHAMPELPVNWIAGRSWREAVRLLPALVAGSLPPRTADNAGDTVNTSSTRASALADETLLDLAEHAAESKYMRDVANRSPVLDMSTIARCRLAVESGWRLVLRADSTRRSSEELMRFVEEESGASRVITGDDPGVLRASSVVLSQYAGIIAIAAGRRSVNCVERRAVWERIEGAIGGYVTRGWPDER